MNVTQFWQWGANGRPTFNFDESEVNQGNIEDYIKISCFEKLHSFDKIILVNTSPSRAYLAEESISLNQFTEADFDTIFEFAHFYIFPNKPSNEDLKMILSDIYDNDKILYEGPIEGKNLNVGCISKNIPINEMSEDVYDFYVDGVTFHKATLLHTEFHVRIRIVDLPTNKLLFNYDINVVFQKI
ncbi:hypothetical protein [Capnocytophaga canis]|uniref:hypothetical protein n=1 Tax=Capnocytophaga canis TaxID=1848903 RepID=UPI0037D8D431